MTRRANGRFVEEVYTEDETPKVIIDDRSLLWRVWWAFGFAPILWLLRLVPIAEWRRDQWSLSIDIWAMDHIGRRRPKPKK